MPIVSRLRQRSKSGSNHFSRCLLGLFLIGMFWLASELPQARARVLSQTGSTSSSTLSERRVVLNPDPDDNCLMCHADPDFKGSFQNGELFSLYVDNGEYEQSVHGPAGLNCVACHVELGRYPHHSEEQITCLECHGEDGGTADALYATLRVNLPYADHREMTLVINESCRSCHEQEYEVAGPSAHVKVFEGGNRDSATCIDCHGSHDISRPEEPRAQIAYICGECHKAVYSTYHSSVHGAALTASNPDVPTCVDCHEVHNVRGPRDPTYRNDSIAICGGCHSDEALMTKYEISSDVLETYIDDFHGRTVNLFRLYDTDTPSDKAVCFDCHGIHNIRRADDPLSMIHIDNIQQTCRQCHEGASDDFVNSWLNHVVPTLENEPIISSVNLAYSVLTPLTIGGFMVYIALDAFKRRSEKRQIIRRAQALAEKELKDYDLTDDIQDLS